MQATRPAHEKRAVSTLRTLALCALGGATFAAGAQPAFVRDGDAGFVVTEISYALSKDATETGVCPDGMTQGMRREGARPESPANDGAPSPAAAPGLQANGSTATATDEAERRFIATLMDPNRPNACLNPQAFGPDPGFRTVKIPEAKAYGIDLDGRVSRAGDRPAGGACAHDDLVGMNGERGVDNQFFRVVGCSNSYQSTGQSNTFTIEMHTGSWGILITLSGVDDVRNDNDVEIGLFANADPIELSPTREPLPDATYAVDQDPRFQAKARGRIINGVLTTDPVDVRFHKITNSIYLERPLREARLHATLSEEGVLEGYLAGYTPVEDLYDMQYAFRNGKNASGEPADARLIRVSASGQAAVLGHTCNGAYYALHGLADGHPDSQTGKCTSISTQYRIKAIPAFIVNVKTESLNKDLERR